jgi:hypothetical protein
VASGSLFQLNAVTGCRNGDADLCCTVAESLTGWVGFAEVGAGGGVVSLGKATSSDHDVIVEAALAESF